MSLLLLVGCWNSPCCALGARNPRILERAAAIVEEYDTAVTLRQVHYRLVAEAQLTGSGYLNTESDYQNLSRLSAEARRNGDFPPLLDRTRTIERAQTWGSPAEALATLGGLCVPAVALRG